MLVQALKTIRLEINWRIVTMANKQDLIAKVAEATELTKKIQRLTVDAVFASIEEFLCRR